MGARTNGTHGIAWLALFLFVGGLLLPILIFAVLTGFTRISQDLAYTVSLCFGAISELLALVLGLVGWRHVVGKVAAIGAGLVAALTMAGMLAWFLM